METVRKAPDRIGVLMGIASSFLWGTTFVSGRYLLREPAQIDPIALVFMRFIIGGLTAVMLGSLMARRWMVLPKNVRWYEVLLPAFFLYFLMSWMLFLGQRNSSAANGALMLEVSPVLIVVVWEFLRGRKIPGREWAAVAIGSLGAVMVLGFISRDGFSTGQGGVLPNLVMFGGAISWVIGSALAKKIVPPGRSLPVTAWMMAAAGVMVIPLLLCCWSSLRFPDRASGWGAVLYMGLFPTGLAFYCWNEAVARLELGVLTMIQFLTPVFTLVLARAVLGEEITLFKALGMLLVLGALAVMHIHRHGKTGKAGA